jgi:hypothetical protein
MLQERAPRDELQREQQQRTRDRSLSRSLQVKTEPLSLSAALQVSYKRTSRTPPPYPSPYAPPYRTPPHPLLPDSPGHDAGGGAPTVGQRQLRLLDPARAARHAAAPLLSTPHLRRRRGRSPPANLPRPYRAPPADPRPSRHTCSARRRRHGRRRRCRAAPAAPHVPLWRALLARGRPGRARRGWRRRALRARPRSARVGARGDGGARPCGGGGDLRRRLSAPRPARSAPSYRTIPRTLSDPPARSSCAQTRNLPPPLRPCAPSSSPARACARFPR